MPTASAESLAVAKTLVQWVPPGTEHVPTFSSEEAGLLELIIALTIDIHVFRRGRDLDTITLVELHRALLRAGRGDLPAEIAPWHETATSLIYLHLLDADKSSPPRDRFSEFTVADRVHSLSGAPPRTTRPGREGSPSLLSHAAFTGGEPVLIIGDHDRVGVATATGHHGLDIPTTVFTDHGGVRVTVSPFGAANLPREMTPGWRAELTGTTLLIHCADLPFFDGAAPQDAEWRAAVGEQVRRAGSICLLSAAGRPSAQFGEALTAGAVMAVRTPLTLRRADSLR